MFESLNVWKEIFVFWVFWELYIDVLSASMSFSVIFCIDEHIWKYVFGFARKCWIYQISKTCFRTKMALHGPPPNSHPRRQQKSPTWGQNNIKKHIVDDFIRFVCKKSKTYPYQGA